MNRKKIIRELKASKRLNAECPSCGEEFSIAKALIFDGADNPPEEAAEVLDEIRHQHKEWAVDLREQAASLRKQLHSATEGAEKKAIEVTLGLVVEKIITGWNDFPHHAYDCTSIFEPIDYVAFDGMIEKRKIDSIAFIDIKTGASRLNKRQRMIRDAVNEGRVDYREL